MKSEKPILAVNNDSTPCINLCRGCFYVPKESAMRLFADHLWPGSAFGQLAWLRISVLLHGNDPGDVGILVRREKIIGINLSTPE